MSLKSIQKKSLYEEIVYQIVQYIKDEKLAPGDKLPSEDKLVEVFKVSKAAVREALSILASKGIVEKKPGVGSILQEVSGTTFIENITTQLIINQQTLQEILDFRRIVEVEAAGLAAERASKEQISSIKKAHTNLINKNQQDQIGIKEDFYFHYHIIVSSNNSIFLSIFDAISPKIFEAIKITKKQSVLLSRQYVIEAHEEHERILNAIICRDPHQARQEMLHHLLKNEEKLWTNELTF